MINFPPSALHYVDGFEVHFYGVFINQRTNKILLRQRIAYGGIFYRQKRGDLSRIINFFLDDKPAGGCASLTCCAYSAKHGSTNSDINIRIF